MKINIKLVDDDGIETGNEFEIINLTELMGELVFETLYMSIDKEHKVNIIGDALEDQRRKVYIE